MWTRFATSVWHFPARRRTCSGAIISALRLAGKFFVILGLDDPRLCFKCAPEKFAELVERENIRPAPYVGRYKWVMQDRLDALPSDELKELIRQSYDMVAAKVPRLKSGKSKSRKKKPSGRRKKSRHDT